MKYPEAEWTPDEPPRPPLRRIEEVEEALAPAPLTEEEGRWWLG